ncbi:TraB/VirB10 family protein [Marinomonas algarum]|uniref:Conjugal transfer protein TraB n=1 Tax=Marinomonas algarum TaxID=2883105 RepID=A0A9X1INX4_9GAMM|nr:TrbI/VirB10 family protein [Marinomonas algarum]MCB5162645.1 conjugal transfer protein TraB [Marinomonas algarum]
MSIKDNFDNLSPKTKRLGMMVAAAATVLLVVSVFSDSEQVEKKTSSREKSIRHVLTDGNTRDVGIESLSANLRIMSRENEELRDELARLKNDISKESEQSEALRSDAERELSLNIEKIKQELDLLKEQKNTSPQSLNQNVQVNTTDETNQGVGAVVAPELNQNFDGDYSNPDDFFRNAEIPKQAINENNLNEDGEVIVPKTLSIASYSASKPKSNDDADVAEEETFMPAGSIVTGVLLNGMDAPTAQGARQDPFPATIRIQKEAVLPNRFRADIRECFVIVSGYGDLSSERAYLRGETLSCVKDNGDVIETSFDSYVVGEDGKAGIRGRLVSKQGQIIAKSLMAGFLSGASEAFDVDVVPALNLTGESVEYQNNPSSSLLKGAAAKGASTALDRVAQFYIDMAEGIFPVIEIDAGRQVEIIVTKGSLLKVRDSSSS